MPIIVMFISLSTEKIAQPLPIEEEKKSLFKYPILPLKNRSKNYMQNVNKSEVNMNIFLRQIFLKNQYSSPPYPILDNSNQWSLENMKKSMLSQVKWLLFMYGQVGVEHASNLSIKSTIYSRLIQLIKSGREKYQLMLSVLRMRHNRPGRWPETKNGII